MFLSLLISQVKNINLNELFIDKHGSIKLILMKGSIALIRIERFKTDHLLRSFPAEFKSL